MIKLNIVKTYQTIHLLLAFLTKMKAGKYKLNFFGLQVLKVTKFYTSTIGIQHFIKNHL